MQNFNNPFIAFVPEFALVGDYNQCSFWAGNHPLSKAYTAILQDTSRSKVSGDSLLNAFVLVGNCYYDLYNNGGGNASRWTIRTALRKATKSLSKEVQSAIMDAQDDVRNSMNAKWFPCYAPHAHRMMERLMTHVVYVIVKEKPQYQHLLPEAA